MSRRKQAVFKWLREERAKHRLKTRFPSITHFYQGGLFGSQTGPLEHLFGIKGRNVSNIVEWRGHRYLVEVGNYRDTDTEDPMENIFVYAFVTGVDEEISQLRLTSFLTYHEKKVRMRPVKKATKP